MQINHHTFISFIFFIVLIGNLSAESSPSQKKGLAIIRDGQSWYFDDLIGRVKKELLVLNSGKEPIQIFDDFNAEGKGEKINQFLDEINKKSNIDVIFAAGEIVSNKSMRLPEADRKIPIISGSLLYSEPKDYPISNFGTSEIKNYSFTSNPQRVEQDLLMLQRLSEEKLIHVLIDESFYNDVKDDIKRIEVNMEKRMGIDFDLHTCGSQASATLEQLPKNTKAVYITRLPHLPPDERKKLFSKLAERGIVTLSMLGIIDVEFGALAGLATDHRQVVARRLALNAHLIFQGQTIENLPVVLPAQDHLVINMEAARQAKWSPDYETALEAEFINEESDQRLPKMSLEKAMAIAAKQEDSLRASRIDEELGDVSRREIHVGLHPQLDLVGLHANEWTRDPINTFLTPDRSQTTQYGLELRQILFNEESNMRLKSTLHSIEALKHDTRSRELDAIYQTASAYLNCLKAKTLYRIEKENLRLTENNLNLAKLRLEIGSAESSEVYRWEQSQATTKSSLFQREADWFNAIVQFNQTISMKQSSKWNFQDIDLKDDETYFMDGTILNLVRRQNDLNRFKTFIKDNAIENAPELKAFKERLLEQNIVYDFEKRPYRLPDISFQGQAQNAHVDSQFQDLDSESSFQLSLQFNLSLYEGGLRKIEKVREKMRLERIEASLKQARNLIKQNAWNAAHNLSAAHVNIRLSRRANEASRKNYQAIQEKYSQGAASILDLLDAQRTLIQNRQQSSIAVYDYLDVAHQVQRAMAWFEYEKSEEQKKVWITQLKDYLKKNQP